MSLHPADIRPAYLHDDNVAYLTWFAGQFSSVFVALAPFVRSIDHASSLQGTTFVRWSEIALACRFPSLAHVNRALRMTGSKRVLPALANIEDTRTLLEYGSKNAILAPVEGSISLPFQIEIAQSLLRSGTENVSAAGHFGIDPQPMPAARFSGPDLVNSADILACVGSFYTAIYTDYHYMLVCQTDMSRKAIDPSTIFEGFFATPKTTDFWGIGDLSDAPT